MTTKRGVLVAYDFDGRSDAALRAAMDLAARSDRALSVVHVLPTVADEASPAVTAATARIAALVPAKAEIMIRGGQAAQQILACAERSGPDRIVMGTHQRGRVGRTWHGSVVEAVAKEASVPMLIVPSDESPTPASPRSVVCVVDFEHDTAEAIELAQEHARDLDASLRLLHVVEPSKRDLAVGGEPLHGPSRRLGELAEQVRASTWTILQGAASDRILDAVRSDRPLALVIPAHSRSRPALGDVSRLVAHSPVPLLVSPSHGAAGWRRAATTRREIGPT